MLALTTAETAGEVARAAGAFLKREDVAGSVLELRADLTGLVIR
jgi:hypothetical protein